jgi:hypothetical protein
MRDITRDSHHPTSQGPFPAVSEPRLSPVSPCQRRARGRALRFYFVSMERGSTDSGTTDGSTTDGGTTDGSTTDGGPTDGESTDGESTDGESTGRRGNGRRENGRRDHGARDHGAQEPRRADGRLMECLKSFIFVRHKFWASLSQKLSQSAVWASF